MLLKQKNNKKLILQILASATVLGSLIFGSALAQPTIDELKNSIAGKQQQLDQINTEIQNLQQQIVQKQKQTASLKNEITLYDLQIRQTQQQINAVQIQIDQTGLQIGQIEADVQVKQDAIDKEKTYLAEELRLLNEYDAVTPLEMTIANQTFSNFLDQIQYAANLQENTQTVLSAVKTLKSQLEQKKSDLTDQLAKQDQLKSQLAQTQNSLQDQRGARQTLLLATKGQERTYQSLLTTANQKQQEVASEIYRLDLSVRQQLGDKSLPPINGLLRWPMRGIVTQGYGDTGFRALGYNFHNGIDIAAPAGTQIIAAGDGIVYATGTGNTGYGNWVVVKHAINKDDKIYSIYTLYGHLQNFVVKPGQVVLGGDTIGYEGNTGNTTRLLYGPDHGYHLHFSVFDTQGFNIQDGAYQNLYGPYQIPYGYTYDPMQFLSQ